jgi:ArsR family transcriptional regulator
MIRSLVVYFDECRTKQGSVFLNYMGQIEGYTEDNDIVRVAKALSDATRLRIYQEISASKNIFCKQIVEKYGLTPGTISHHLKILADANLIETRREGQFMYLKSRPQIIRSYGRALNKIAEKRKAASSR